MAQIITRFSDLVAAVLAVQLGLALLMPVVAAAAGIGQPCGGPERVRCDSALWCEQPRGTCDGSNISGTCVKLPISCDAIYLPVCGCDKKTYESDCDTRGKVQIDNDGECR